MRIFADTNVLFDVFAQREPFRESSCKLLIMQMFGDAEIWAAPQSYLNIFYVLKKAQPAHEAQKALAASLEQINLCTTSHEDVLSALEADWDDVEDALIAESCKKVGADFLLTRDKSREGFAHLSIPALTPEEFFDRMAAEGIVYGEVEL